MWCLINCDPKIAAFSFTMTSLGVDNYQRGSPSFCFPIISGMTSFCLKVGGIHSVTIGRRGRSDWGITTNRALHCFHKEFYSSLVFAVHYLDAFGPTDGGYAGITAITTFVHHKLGLSSSYLTSRWKSIEGKDKFPGSQEAPRQIYFVSCETCTEDWTVEVPSFTCFASNLKLFFWDKVLAIVSTPFPLPIEEGTTTPLLFTGGLKTLEVFFTPVGSKGAEPSRLLLAILEVEAIGSKLSSVLKSLSFLPESAVRERIPL